MYAAELTRSTLGTNKWMLQLAGIAQLPEMNVRYYSRKNGESQIIIVG
jgi:hypothetical protein